MTDTEIFERLQAANTAGTLLDASLTNLRTLLSEGAPRLYFQSVEELVRDGNWCELNDRFFRTLAFGTGGLRGRTIGRVVTAAERGTPTDIGRPEFPCVGTNAMNTFNIVRATRGLVAYLRAFFEQQGRSGRPLLVIAHDVRHFSREFAELTARVAAENGCDAALFPAPRSTPELSFAVRHLGAQGGIVITASHNPPHDNGYKVYFADGGQIVEPHASEIISRVNAITSEAYEPVDEAQRGQVRTLGIEIDEAYMSRLETLIVDRDLVAKQKGTRVVFSPIHGTGAVIGRPMLKRLGFDAVAVDEQEQFDGRFPTVKSPNPENAEALKIAIERADELDAGIVMATDPDCDRLGVAVRDRDGRMILLTGNQIASVIAHYRVTRLCELGVITPENAGRCVLIKTVVTTDLLRAIAEKHGMRCVETLTGFKYIGEKLAKYQNALPAPFQDAYASQTEIQTRDARLAHSSYYVFGGEESYGYSGADFVRDKDGNGAAIMFAETAAYAASEGLTMDELLDRVYAIYGYYLEKSGSLTFEGAEGALTIGQLTLSYATEPPTHMDGCSVVSIKDFALEDILDADGDLLPKEKMIQIGLKDGRRIAIRPSGTEPKIKFYLFACKPAPEGGLAAEDVETLKSEIPRQLESLWQWIQQDVQDRIKRTSPGSA